ncbi:MAG: PhoH-like protein [Syntrophomonadaceae bacterium]|nr:PhoH-like protein [Bacillota bacterium]
MKSARVAKIEFIDSTEEVYDIMVNGNHNFFTNGVLSSNCYVILDEAQNTTIEQMKLFVTRIGEDSQFVINGDASQSDLQGVVENGLEWAVRKLGGGKSRNINLVEFRNSDSVRSTIVTEILHLIDSPDNRVSSRSSRQRGEPSILSA